MDMDVTGLCIVSDRRSRDAFGSVGVCDGCVDLMSVAACAPTKRGKKLDQTDGTDRAGG